MSVKKRHKQKEYAEVLGKRKMINQTIKDANTFQRIKDDPEAWSRLVNFGLPEITDMQGPAEC